MQRALRISRTSHYAVPTIRLGHAGATAAAGISRQVSAPRHSVAWAGATGAAPDPQRHPRGRGAAGIGTFSSTPSSRANKVCFGAQRRLYESQIRIDRHRILSADLSLRGPIRRSDQHAFANGHTHSHAGTHLHGNADLNLHRDCRCYRQCNPNTSGRGAHLPQGHRVESIRQRMLLCNPHAQVAGQRLLWHQVWFGLQS
jgi:hypothetical protein